MKKINLFLAVFFIPILSSFALILSSCSSKTEEGGILDANIGSLPSNKPGLENAPDNGLVDQDRLDSEGKLIEESFRIKAIYVPTHLYDGRPVGLDINVPSSWTGRMHWNLSGGTNIGTSFPFGRVNKQDKIEALVLDTYAKNNISAKIVREQLHIVGSEDDQVESISELGVDPKKSWFKNENTYFSNNFIWGIRAVHVQREGEWWIDFNCAVYDPIQAALSWNDEYLNEDGSINPIHLPKVNQIFQETTVSLKFADRINLNI